MLLQRIIMLIFVGVALHEKDVHLVFTRLVAVCIFLCAKLVQYH